MVVLPRQAEDLLMDVARRHKAAAAASRGGAGGDDPEAGQSGAKHTAAAAAGQRYAGATSGAPLVDAGPPAEPAPDVHPAALQAALSARRSLGSGLWWPGERQPSQDADAAGAAADMGLVSGLQPERGQAREGRQPSGGAALRSGHSDASLGGTYSTYSGSGSDSGSDNGSDGASDSDDGEGGGDGAPGGAGGGGRTAIALELLDLAVDNIDVIEPHHLKLQVRCNSASELDHSIACAVAVVTSQRHAVFMAGLSRRAAPASQLRIAAETVLLESIIFLNAVALH